MARPPHRPLSPAHPLTATPAPGPDPLPVNRRRRAGLAVAAAAAIGLGGCATLQSIQADVASFGDWPAGRAPGTYAFDPLPSQQADAAGQAAVEAALRPVLARAGFSPAAPGTQPELLVQAGSHTSRSAGSPWDDPMWWNGGFGFWGPARGPWRGPYWGASMRWQVGGSPRYEREVAVLLRDRASGKPLYEGRASIDSFSSRPTDALGPLFTAAMADFPTPRPERHTVSVPLQAGPATAGAPPAR